MSTIKYYQYCSVPLCINNINRTPDKLFIPVPHDPDRRKKWMKLARRDWKKQSIKSMIYFCEDHFDLPNDMENYMQYRIQGYIKKIRMKAGCLPSRFACQLDRKGTAPCADRNVIVKRKRQTLVEEALKEAANEEMPKCTEVKGNPGICRCCMSEGCYKDLGSEYSWMGDTEVYADMLLDCFDISITQHNEGPNGPNRLICEVCITRLRDACNFKKQVMDSEKKFIDMIGRGQFKPQVMVHQKVMKVELDDDGIDDTVEYLEEDMEFTDADDEPLKRPSPQPSASTLQLKAKRGRPRKSALTKHETKKEDKPKASKAVVKGVRKTSARLKPMTANERNRLMKGNAITILETSTVIPFKWHRQNYLCFFCHHTFDNFESLKHHTVVELDKCSVKSAVLYLRGDEKVKIDVSSITCRLCDQGFVDINTLIDHVKVDHKKTFIEHCGYGIVPYRLQSNTFQCAICNADFQCFIKLNQHMNDHYGNYICELCGKSFLSKDRLRCHSLNHGSGFRCGTCSKSFDTLKQRQNHEAKVHNKDKLLKCIYCKDTFANYNLRRRHHITAHNVQTPVFNCPVCGKVFQIMSKMKIHLREVHIKEKNIQCSMCDLKLFSKAHLQKHMVKHMGEKIYHCEVCKKSYSRKQTLKDHMRIHSNGKRIECSMCSQTFVRANALRLHMRERHPDVLGDH